MKTIDYPVTQLLKIWRLDGHRVEPVWMRLKCFYAVWDNGTGTNTYLRLI